MGYRPLMPEPITPPKKKTFVDKLADRETKIPLIMGNNRPPGYYWVLGNKEGYRGLLIAEYNGSSWMLPGTDALFDDADFNKIDERPIMYDHEVIND